MEMLSSIHGILLGSYGVFSVLGALVLLLAVGFVGASLKVWSAALVALMIGFGFPWWLMLPAVAVLALFNVTSLRKSMVSTKLMKIMKGVLPKISDTERTALEAGVVWVEGDLFSGKPDFKKIMKEPYPELTAEEQAFVDGPVNDLCAAIDEWEVWKTRELQEEAWNILRREKFFGMIIPKEYGGLGFSALAHSAVIQKISTRSSAASITTMVPNSLGPAELLVHYGTQEQKDYYLPRLAKGEEMPCFALTEPTAGSDAGSLVSDGVLFKGQDDKLYMRLNWNKRWITLAAISTVLGMAFRLRDPDNLLGKGEDVGITCALIPSDTKGVDIGRRHDPLGVPFYNCPTHGKNVVVPADCIIGGVEKAGEGWEMLMSSLAAGRGISLPSVSAGLGKMASRAVSAHATVRRQFGMSIGKFEGIEEPLARIAGYSYILEAMRRFTVGSIDQGIKPPVITAMAKYHSTELSRKIVIDGMDVMGGAGISMGPRNLMAIPYIGAPISITVEGANILTRTLMIFGQGALRAHPYAYKEVAAVEKNDLSGFDKAFWSHIGHVVRNTCRSIALSFTRGRLASSPVAGPTAVYYRRLAWASASFAIMSDIAMGSLGGSLKVKEKLTGRFADILSWMYIGSAVLRRYEAEGRKKEDLPFVHFALQHALSEIQNAFDGIFQNLKVPGLTWLFKYVIGNWARINTIGMSTSDYITHKIAKQIQTDGEQRDRMTEGMFIASDPEDQMKRLDTAFSLVKKAEPVEKKIKQAIRSKQLPKKALHLVLDEAKEKSLITAEEYDLVKEAYTSALDAIQVDDFSEEEYHASEVKTESSGPVRLAS